jgi:hypothetical protein
MAIASDREQEFFTAEIAESAESFRTRKAK